MHIDKTALRKAARIVDFLARQEAGDPIRRLFWMRLACALDDIVDLSTAERAAQPPAGGD